MAKTGHMYTYDSSQNVTFPAAITSGAINSYNVVPRTNNTYNLGSSSYKWANVYATTIYENGTSLTNKYLGKTAKAADADKLDGNDSAYYLNYNNLNNRPTIPAAANNGTITIKQTGISDQTFTVNQSGNKTITLVDTNTWRPLGTGASDACAGNDPRLSDARTPKAHTHVSNDITDALTLIQGNNITLTQTASGLKISAAADGKVKTVNNQQPDSNGNVQLTAANVGARASDWMPTAAQVGALANNASVVYYTAQTLTNAQKTQARTNIGAGTSSLTLGTTSSTAAAGNHNHDGVYLKSFTESDPVFSASAAAGIKASDITNWNGKTSNKGTVTSVRVQAGTGLSSSQNTAQTSTLNTTISIANGYKLPTTTEWAERPSINDAYSISAGNGIVLTPTANSLKISAALKTVNTISPDANGNVQLTAANVGALPIDNAVDSLNINKELACGSNGKICVGKFGVYDSNITLNVSSTTSNTYSGTIVIATQNGIICNAKVYGDATKALSNILYIAQESYNSSSKRGVVGVYLNLAG